MFEHDLQHSVIFDKLVTYLKFKSSVINLEEIRPFLFHENEEFRQYYGEDGLKHYTSLLQDWKVRKIFDDELNPLIKLTGSVRNYISNYIYCVELEPDKDYTDVSELILQDLNEVSSDFKYKVIELFKDEIQKMLDHNQQKIEFNSNSTAEFDENNWLNSMMIDSMLNIHIEETGEDISREEIIKLFKKQK